MRRGLKISAWTGLALLTLFLLLTGALLVLGNTDGGRALITRVTSRLTDGHVQLSGIGGTFPQAVDLARLQLSDDRGVWLVAEHISLRWSPMALLTRHVKVDALHVARLHIERAPQPRKDSKPSAPISIPHSDLADVSVDVLELGPELAGTAVSLVFHGSAHLRSLQDATASIVAQRTGGIGRYELQLQFDPARMDAVLKIQEPAHGPLENILKVPGLGDLTVLAKLNGPRDAERVQLDLDAGSLRARAEGTVNLTAASADLQYSLTAAQVTPYPGLSWQSIDFQGRWHGSVKAPSADGRLQVKQLLMPGGTALAGLNADLVAQGGLLTVRAVVEGLTLPGPRPRLLADEPLTLEGSVRLSEKTLPINVTATHRLFALQAHGMGASPQSAQLDLRLPDVAPFAALGGQKLRGSASIKAQVTHDSESSRFTADATASIDGTPPWVSVFRDGVTRLQVAGELSEQKVTVQRLQLTGSSVSLSASGTSRRAAANELDARWDLTLPNLTKLSPALAGTLSTSGQLSGPANSFTVTTELSSTLSIHGSPTGTVSANVRAEGLPTAPRGTAEAHGDLDGAPLVLDVSVERENASSVRAVIHHADWKSAHIEGDLRSGPDIARARGHLEFHLSQLSDLDRLLASGIQGSLAGTLTLAPASGSSSAELHFTAHELAVGGITTDAQLDGHGNLAALSLKLGARSASLGGEPASLESEAQLDLETQELRFASAQIIYHDQTARLLSPATLSFAKGLSIADFQLGAQQAVLEVGGRLAPTLDARASLRQIKPELVNAFVPRLLATGTIQADLQLQGAFSTPTGTVKVDATGLRAANDAARGLPATDIHASAELSGDTAVVDASLVAGSASRLALTGQAPLTADEVLDLKLSGTLDMTLLNPLLEARGRHVTGTLTVDTTVTGNAAAPQISGRVRLVKGSLRDYTQGTNLSDINGELSGSDRTLRIESLTARAAPGSVSVQGTIGVLEPKIPVDLRLTAQGAQPIANNIVTANLDGDIRVSGTARERLDVAGSLHVKRADVQIPSSLPPNVAVLDVRRPGRTAPPPSDKQLIIGLNVTVDAPRQILVKGRGLDAELGGEIRVRGTTEEPSISGGFDLQRGFFTLASSKLTFSNGNVTFNGAGLKKTIDPTLDFTAQTQVQDVTATVRITGLADSPKIELSSTPDLPQDEILARLLFGESASQLTAVQVVQIGAALATLSGGGVGFNPVAKIQKALGLDRLSVGGASNSGPPGTQSSGASIEAGRYVSSRVFVAVKESTTGASQLAVDVDLTKHLKLQTRLGNGTATAQGTTPENDPGSSVGIAYQFEY